MPPLNNRLETQAAKLLLDNLFKSVPTILKRYATGNYSVSQLSIVQGIQKKLEQYMEVHEYLEELHATSKKDLS